MPVTKLESSEARNTATLATSSGSPMRPIGMVARSLAMASGGCRSIWGVLIGPGLRVHPGSSQVLAELSDHEPDGGPAQEGERIAVQALPILCQAAAAIEPGDGPLDDPALGKHDEPACIGTLDDLDVDLSADAGQAVLEFWPLVAAVGVELDQERKRSEQARHQQH